MGRKLVDFFLILGYNIIRNKERSNDLWNP